MKWSQNPNPAIAGEEDGARYADFLAAMGNLVKNQDACLRECLKNGLHGMNARGELRIHD